MPHRRAHAPGASILRRKPRFVDDAEPAGLRFTFDNGLETLHQMPETMSGGVGLLDYDGDGWLDVYVVQGGQVSPQRETPRTPAIAFSATRATARSRTSPSDRESRRCPRAMATA